MNENTIRTFEDACRYIGNSDNELAKRITVLAKEQIQDIIEDLHDMFITETTFGGMVNRDDVEDIFRAIRINNNIVIGK